MSAKTFHLTNEEIVRQLSLRDDLTELETDLLDRLIRATEEVTRLERENYVLEERVRVAGPQNEGAISP